MNCHLNPRADADYMCGDRSTLLVKAEWDEAEKWLGIRPNGDN